MDKKWPFGFFVYNDIGSRETNAEVEVEVLDAEVEVEVLDPEVTEIPQAAEIPLEEVEIEADLEDDVVAEDVDNYVEEDEDDENLPDLEEELEIALEAAHEEGVKKNRIIKGVTAGIALLGAIGLATGFGIRAYLKNK